MVNPHCLVEIVNLPQTLGVWNVQLPIFSKRTKTSTHSGICEITKIPCFPWNVAYSFFLHIDASKHSIHDIKHCWYNSLHWNAYEDHESCLAHDRVWLQRKVQNFDHFHGQCWKVVRLFWQLYSWTVVEAILTTILTADVANVC